MTARDTIDQLFEMGEYRLGKEREYTTEVNDGIKINGEHYSLSQYHRWGKWSGLSWREIEGPDGQSGHIEVYATASLETADKRRHRIQVTEPMGPSFLKSFRALIEKAKTRRNAFGKPTINWKRETEKLRQTFAPVFDRLRGKLMAQVEEWIQKNNYASVEIEGDVEEVPLPDNVREEPDLFWRILVPHIQDFAYVVDPDVDKFSRFVHMVHRNGDKLLRLDIKYRGVFFIVKPGQEQPLKDAIRLALRDFVQAMLNKNPEGTGEDA